MSRKTEVWKDDTVEITSKYVLVWSTYLRLRGQIPPLTSNSRPARLDLLAPKLRLLISQVRYR